MPKEIKVDGRMKVKTLKSDFEEAFGATIRVYHGRKFASDDATLASIRKGEVTGGDFALHGNMKVGNAEEAFKESLGITIQIEDETGGLADNDISLAAAGRSEGDLSGEQADVAEPAPAPPVEPAPAPPVELAPVEKKKGCFVATAVMGDYDHPVVMDLRVFRDNILEPTPLGHTFIRMYYAVGPLFARMIEKSAWAKKVVFYCMIKPVHTYVKKKIR